MPGRRFTPHRCEQQSRISGSGSSLGHLTRTQACDSKSLASAAARLVCDPDVTEYPTETECSRFRLVTASDHSQFPRMESTGVERHRRANRQVEWSFWEKRHRTRRE